MRIIDISTPISPNTPVWPKTPKPKFGLISSIKDGASSDDTKIEMSVHTGTHIDAPSHFLAGGKSIAEMDLDIFTGPVFVAHLPEVKKITGGDIEKLKIPEGMERLLFKTSNSLLWGREGVAFKKDYVGLSVDAAEALAGRGLKLVGIDYLSIADFSETDPVHRVLMKEGIAILEGLNLSGAEQGVYSMFSAPIMIPGVEAAPARAFLMK